jgi:peptidoglycan/xylan/chitin deacetylase (PgdA/CDA1 family)
MKIQIIHLVSVLFAVTSFCSTTATADPIDPAKVVMIKADDFRTPSAAWTAFLKASRDAGVKVGLGAVVTSLAGKDSTARWMQEQQAKGDVEFWNHGWDHTRWTTNGTEVSEFKGSGLAYMQQHLADAQAGLNKAAGKDVIAFGTGYNGFDTDTATVINATPALRLFFARNVSSVQNRLDARVAVVKIIGESDGTGKPSAAKFAAEFPPGTPGPIAMQLHPANSSFDAARLDEYQKILQYLLTNGYSILLPSEYVGTLPAVGSAAQQ